MRSTLSTEWHPAESRIRYNGRQRLHLPVIKETSAPTAAALRTPPAGRGQQAYNRSLRP
jgi:hypothetical protein